MEYQEKINNALRFITESCKIPENAFKSLGSNKCNAEQTVKNHNENVINTLNAGYKYFMKILEPHDIALNPIYKKMGEKVLPVWITNSHGSQITFLIKE